ncbi:hypothetical protein ADIS_3461 [Lunatimonas lonarensis]|uniref:SMODS and SLOG-associating 2TM effector domain-containing protein n=1 Tax=Lunatimonas lonarensis TaxID=1232681 RepID=R7ZQK5_9BACT|nr:SLATT domain-containing protein [Lunatimonas lonarensis]EON76333.1 hypothetical protein ADIS_3461 [Lunatimonas lonarensis]
MDNQISNTYHEIISKATDDAQWYVDNQVWMKRLSKSIRLGSIVLFALGGLIPMIHSLLLENEFPVNIVNLGYISIAAAGTLLLLDKFFGFSSGWIRFITTHLEMKRKIVEFEMRWKIETFGKNLDEISEEEGKVLLSMLADFISQINDIKYQETNAWVSEFQSNLAELQRSVHQKSESSSPGNIKVSLVNTGPFDKLKIRLDNNLGMADVKGPGYLFRDVKPGYHQVTLLAESSSRGSNQEFTAVAHVEAGKLAEVLIDLGGGEV